jgi:hypothetical protein
MIAPAIDQVQQGVIDHVAFVVDISYSTHRIAPLLARVADDHIAQLAASANADQETRGSVYLFNDHIYCKFFDKDVLRLPKIQGTYRADGNTALCEATLRAIEDLKQTPQLYGKHAFLLYVITDGEENQSSPRARATINGVLTDLPDNFTVVALVPNQKGRQHAINHGFPEDNIYVWDATPQGVEKVGEVLHAATQAWSTARRSGTFTGTRSIFSLTGKDVTAAVAQGGLEEIPKRHYQAFVVPSDDPLATHEISDFVQYATGKPYVKKTAFYQWTKGETIGPSKLVAVRRKSDGALFAGDAARQMIGIGGAHAVRVQKPSPELVREFDVFVQSTSTNRKLVPGSTVLVLDLATVNRLS